MKRVAIVGTAGSWKQTPWGDTTLAVWSLNDAYRLPGFVRADAWFDFHPIDKFYHVAKDQPMFAHQVPPGHYVRPHDHLPWLANQAQTIPVYLHPDYLTACPEAAQWPQARPFPKAEIETVFGRYFTSSPAWMLALAMLQGAEEVHIYGIHLATEHEYIDQRPQFEYLIGRFLGDGPLQIDRRNGLRVYTAGTKTLVLPESSPILQSDFQYAFEPRPRSFVEPLKWDLHRFTVKRQRALQALIDRPWYQRRHPLRDELQKWDAYVSDTQEQMQRMQAAQQIGA